MTIDNYDNFIDGLNDRDVHELLSRLSLYDKEKSYKHNINIIREHNSYVGKCYKRIENDKYVMVLSSRSINEYHVTCLCFEFPVEIKEDRKLYREFTPDSAFSNVKFKGIHIENILMFTDSLFRWEREYVEISKEEYFKKMREYIDELERRINNKEFSFSLDL